MIRGLIKKSLSEKQLEKVFRMKQSVKDSGVFQKHFKILPASNCRIGDEVIPANAIFSMSIKGWRNLIALYEKSGNEEKLEFRSQVKAMILSDASSATMLGTTLVRNVFSAHRSMYLEFLGIAYYAKGDLKNAFNVFKELDDLESSERTCLYMSRCLMHIGGNDELVQLLQKGSSRFPGSALLLLPLANAYFRNGKTDLANETLGKINKEALKEIQSRSHNLENLKKEIEQALADKTIVRPTEKLGFQAYTEESVQYYWETLFYHFVNKSRFQHGWSDLCYITEARIEQYLKKCPDIKSVLNFGVFCAVPDYNLSVRHPDINFIGVDREQSTKNLNDTAFQGKNLSFHALDMIDIIYDDRTEVKQFITETVRKNPELMIFHARTATLIYPEALKKFYKCCAALGVKYISMYENMCISRSYMQYFDFDNLPADAIPFFSIMMIHNYKKYLEEAGYEIIENETWNYSDILWEGKDLYGAEAYSCLGDGHVTLLAKLR